MNLCEYFSRSKIQVNMSLVQEKVHVSLVTYVLMKSCLV